MPGSTVAFEGAGTAASHQFGTYTTGPGGLQIVANNNTAIPGGTGNFTGTGVQPAISGSNVVFEGKGSGGQTGIYLSSAAGLSVVANTSTLVPGGTANFTAFDDHPVISGNTVVFLGSESNGVTGLFSAGAGGLTLLADSTMLSPDGRGPLALATYAVSGDTVAFTAEAGRRKSDRRLSV